MSQAESILVVDDDESLLFICAKILAEQGFQVTTAQGGQDALKLVEAKPFDVVLTDLMMPGCDGREVLRGIKTRRPETDVVIMTGSPTLESAIAALKDGATDYLLKPFSPNYLRATVRMVVENRRTRSQLAVEKQLREELQAAYSELRRMEQLKDGFIARVSHELRTPLATVCASLDLIGKTPPGADAGERLRAARDGADRLSEAIEHLLSFVEVQSPELTLRKTPLLLADIILPITEQLRPQIEAQRLSLGTEFPADLPPVPGDAAYLGKAFRHIIVNAIRFNREGGYLRILARRHAGYVLITVHDSGEGIPEEHRQSIFLSFYQVAEFMSRSVGGLGLGLSLARKIVEAHGGAITVDSTPGEGSAFTVHLPI